MIINNDTTKISTIPSFIENGIDNSLNLSKNVRYVNCSNIGKNIPLENIFVHKYRKTLLENSEEFIMTAEEQNKYKYRPKMLSYDIYGTVEYWSILMILNNVPCISEFNLKRVKYIPQDKLTVIENIMNKEHGKLDIKNTNPTQIKSI